jgi:amino acid transporter
MKISAVKKLFVGSPLATAQARHERLSKTSALAVFSSDALSSVAYATEEILLVLMVAGTAALVYSIPIGLAIAVLIAVVVSSYRQTILAYPQGGGSYIVTKDNLGQVSGLVSAGALLIDYVLTVAVSVAAGVAAITSAFPGLYDYRIGIPLVVLTSPYRSLLTPFLDYANHLLALSERQVVTIVIPEFVPARWWQHLLHNQTALLIKGALLFRKGVVVVDVPFHLR